MTGFVPAAIGAGPGLFIMPPMFAIGIPPKIVITTGIFVVFLSGFTSSVLYAIQGFLSYDYSLIISLITAVGVLIGIKI